MVQSKRVFVLGPGYVGREIIDLLRTDGYHITALVRRESAEKELKNDGLTVFRGDLNDSALIRDLASQSDIVFHTATSDHLASANAILDGIRIRAGKGLQTIYLHQSGTSVLSDGSSDQLNPQIFSDTDAASIDALADDAPHRPIDLAILKARKELGSKAKIFIMIPPIIYGVNKQHERLSIQIPNLTRFALKHKYAGYVGKGKAAWSVIHVLDLAKAYKIILKDLEKVNPEVDLTNPYFFCENGEILWHDLSAIIGRHLYEQGKIESPQPREVPPHDWRDLFGDFTPAALGCNARSRADRLRTMGWHPTQPSIAEAFVNEDAPVLLREVISGP